MYIPQVSSWTFCLEKSIHFPLVLIMHLSLDILIRPLLIGACLTFHISKSSGAPTSTSSPSSTATGSSSPTKSTTAAVVGSKGCGKSLPSAQSPAGGDSHQVTYEVDGVKRHYRLHIPSNYNESNPIPLIFSFHARGKTSSYQEGISNFSNETLNPDAIVVYPQALKVSTFKPSQGVFVQSSHANSFSKDEWQGDPDVKENTDLNFVHNLMNHLKYRYCINENTVYANGMSNGGGLTSLIACNETLSSYFAAVAPVSGAFYYPNTTTEKECEPYSLNFTCSPSRVMPILEMHGMVDTTINYTGGWHRGGCTPDIPHYISQWGERNGVGVSNNSAEIEDDAVMRYQWGDGSNQGIVTHYALKDLGHVWPTKDNSANIDGTKVIMEFFNRWSL